jgi:MoxR-like ATPase
LPQNPGRVADKIQRGFRPHERAQPEQDPAAAARRRRPAPADVPAPAAPGDGKVVEDVLALTHRPAEELEKVRFKKSELQAALTRAGRVAVEDGALSIGDERVKLTKAHAGKLTVLPGNARVIAALHAGLRSGQPTLLSAPPGAGAAYAARWYLEATGRRHAAVRLSLGTSLEALAGALRPDADKKLRVKDGPLADCVRNGGVFVVDGLERADPQVRAALEALARGSKVFHHPASGEPIPVHPDFALVLVQDRGVRAAKDLVRVSNLVEVDAYGRADQQRLLEAQFGLPTALAARLARFQEAVGAAVEDGRLAFGRGFPVGWPQLEQVARRLAKRRDVDDAAVARALVGIYEARLPEDKRAALAQLRVEAGFGPAVLPDARPGKASPGYVALPHHAEPLALALDALAAGETVLLEGPGQSGVTRLVEELAARRKQDVVTVVGHTGADLDTLIETPTFDKKGELVITPGRVAKALLEGKLLYVDHLDHMSREQQNAFFQLQGRTTLKVVEDGKVVERPVHPDARVVLSVTAGRARGRLSPLAQDRASATELKLRGPSLDEAMGLWPAEVTKDAALHEHLTWAARRLHEEDPARGLTKLQRLVDFGRAAGLLAESMPVERAVFEAARLVFELKEGEAFTALREEAEAAEPGRAKDRPLFAQLLGLTQKELDARLAPTGYRLTASMSQHLDALAVAYRLGRPVRAIGPASSGKTVLGAVFAALIEKKNVRVNFSAATESRDLMGGLGPVNEKGKTVFRHVEGPAMSAGQLQAVLTADEWNLSRQGQMVLKTAIDHRRRLVDAEADLERSFETAFFYAAQNPNDPKAGRTEPPPEIADCMFTIYVGAKPVAEKAQIVAAQCDLAEAHVRTIAELYSDLEILAQRGRFKSAVGPITTTERDMLKAARTAHYLIERDGLKDRDAIRKTVGREVYRLIADALLSPAERATVLELVQNHFGDDVTAPPRPAGLEEVRIEGQRYLQLGQARLPIREGGPRVPDGAGVRPPVGEQLEFLESVLLALELNQPLAVVGNTGTGKTMLMRYLAHRLGYPMLEEPYHADMTEEHVFGTTVVNDKGKVEFRYGRLPTAIKEGLLYVGDELTTLGNDTREALNPVTEGSEIQIAQKRPPETIKRADWHPDFRFVVTTNGDDIREDGFSEPEASRFRMLGLRELEDRADLLTIALRDYAAAPGAAAPAPFARTEEGRRAAVSAVLKAVSLPKAAQAALRDLAAAGGQWAGPDAEVVRLPEGLALDAAQAGQVAQALGAFSYDKKDAPARALLNRILAQADLPPGALGRALTGLDPALVEDAVLTRAAADAVVDGRFTRPAEVEQAAALFSDIRDLQRAAPEDCLTPLTPRVFSSFLEILVELRGKRTLAGAMQRAAELTLWPKLSPKLQRKAQARLDEGFLERAAEAKPSVPRSLEHGVQLGDTVVPYGAARPWKANSERFPLTPARCRNLACIAEAMELGRGRPLSLTDDANGEAVETVRELGRLAGRPVTVVTLPPNADLEALIERLELSKDPEAPGGFAAELMQIGQAVRDGHVLVIRGAGNVPSTKLERLNSLGDGRQSLKLPVSEGTLKAHPDFRLVMMRAPNAVHRYSAALENRLLTPPVSTQAAATTREALDNRAAELAAVVRKRCNLPEELANKLGVFHVYLNALLEEGKFTSGRAVGAFLNRDAEAVGRRLAWLLEAKEVDDPTEALLRLVQEVYGERFGADLDVEQLRTRALHAFGADGRQGPFGAELQPSPQITRVGPWMLQRDLQGERPGVPGPEAILPFTPEVEEVLAKVAAAVQFGEVLHLHGDAFFAGATEATLARLTTSPLEVVEGNEELSEAYLFGGLIQDPETGHFKAHEGVVWKAQREGQTLVIRNASRLPAEVLTRLAEVAATGHLSRVKDGELEVQPRAFRLVLETGDGDPPLDKALAAVSTRVRCPQLQAAEDLQAILVHRLRGVPGATDLAAAFLRLTKEVGPALDDEVRAGRQELRFDGTRALEAARQLTAAYAAGRPLEEALADVLLRLYAEPAAGLAVQERLTGVLREIGEALNTNLTLERAEAVDILQNPEVGALRLDYGAVAPQLSGEVLTAGADALGVALDRRDAAGARAALAALAASKVLPGPVRARAEGLLESVRGPRLGEDAAAEVEKLAKYLMRQRAEEAPFGQTLLDFVRGARVWDFEHRLAIVGEYRQAFEALAAHGGAVAQARLQELDRVRERFDAAEAGGKLTQAREAVAKAKAAYERRPGEADAELEQAYAKLIATWDLVCTRTVFRAHALPELAELAAGLHRLLDAHRARGGALEEVTHLSDAFQEAAQALEGIRIAEQAADLRRGLKAAGESAEGLVGSLKDEVATIRDLEAAARTHARLQQAAAILDPRAEFFGLDFAHDEVARPAGRTVAELRAEARRRAEPEVARAVAQRRQALLQEVGALAEQARLPAPANFFAQYDLESADVGLSAAPKPVAPTAAEAHLAKGEVALAAFEQAELKAVEERLLKVLTAEDEARVASEYRDRVKQRAQQVAARVHRTAQELAQSLADAARVADVAAVDPALFAQVEQARAELMAASHQARGWAATMGEVLQQAGRQLVRWATFGLLGGGGDQAAPEKKLELGPAKARAQEVLARLQAHVAEQQAALPDFGKVGEHREASVSLAEALMSADSLGELAAKYTKLAALAGDEGDVELKRYMGQLLTKMASSDRAQVLLGRVHAFCEAADLLSFTAKRGGVAGGFVEAVDAVMRAAEEVRTESLVSDHRASVKALRRALEQLDAVPEAPELLAAVAAEVRGLLEAYEALLGADGGAVDVDRAAFREMLDAIGAEDRVKDLEVVPAWAGPAAGAAGAAQEDLRTAGLEARLDAARHRAASWVDRAQVARSTRLSTVEIAFGRAAPVAEAARAEEAAEAGPAHARIAAAAAGLEARMEASAGAVSRTRRGVLDELKAVEGAVVGRAAAHWQGRLGALFEQLQALIDAAGQGQRGLLAEAGHCLAAAREIAAGLAAIEALPTALAARLDAVVEGARAVAAAYSSQRLGRVVQDWAAAALEAVGEAQVSLQDAAGKLPGAADAGVPDALRRLAGHVETLAAAEGRLGADSKVQLLAHTRGRLLAVARGLSPEDQARVEALIKDLDRAAATQLALGVGAQVEPAAQDAYEATLALAEALAGRKGTDEAAAERFGSAAGALAKLLDAEPRSVAEQVDLAGVAIQVAEALTKDCRGKAQAAARALSGALGHLRRAFLEAGLTEVRDGLAASTQEYLQSGQAARLALEEARSALVTYDPLAKGAPLAEVVRGLQAAVVGVQERLQGPLAPLFAADLTATLDTLAGLARGEGPLAAEARALGEALAAAGRQARRIKAPEDAEARYVTMLERFEAKVAEALAGGASKATLAWAERAQEALEALTEVPPEALAERLAAVEAEHFDLRPKAPPAEVAQDVAAPVAVQSKVAALLARGGGAGGLTGRAADGDEARPAAEVVRVQGGLHVDAPAAEEGPTRQAEGGAAAAPSKAGGKLARDAALGDVARAALPEGGATERSDQLNVVKLSTDGFDKIRRRMSEAIEEARAEVAAEKLLSDYEAFIQENDALVEAMAGTLRQFPGLETVLIIDQSASCKDQYGDSRIIDQERAALAIIMAAHMRAERNCAVVGFGGWDSGDSEPVGQVGRVKIFAHKPMAERLDADVANYVYGQAGKADGATDLIGPMDVALGQFTKKANNKMIHVLTDAQLGNAHDVRRYIEQCRAQGVAVAVQGFGDAHHVQQVAGEYGQHVKSFGQAVQCAKDLFLKAVVENAGRFVGEVDAAAQGIGVATGQAPLAPAEAAGPMDQALLLAEPVPPAGDPAEAFLARGPGREQTNLVDRAKYDRALLALERSQREAAKGQAYKRCLAEVRALSARHGKEGVVLALAEAVSMSLPKTQRRDWERKQLSGPLFDEQQLPMYVAGLAQGVPVMRIFKRRRPVEDTRATVVLALDESSSMGDTEKMRAHLEALLAYGDALKAADPDVKIAVVGFSDKVRLHAGFEQEWGDELKAHLLNQAQGHHDATDDERGLTEGVRLLEMMEAEVGQVVSFSDGQGMPGAVGVMERAAQDGFACLTVGVGPDSKAVRRFGVHGLYVNNLAQLSHRLPAAQLAAWEAAGRIVG